MKHGNHFKDRTGQVFVQLTVLSLHGKNKRSEYLWLCQCACGQKCVVVGGHLASGHTKSCGHLTRRTTHGHSRRGAFTPEYRAWFNMKNRCINPNTPQFSDWGGRGIQCCTRWLNSFEVFLKDLGTRPKGKTLDRTNNNGHYVPSNVRWATPKQQIHNRCRGIVVPFVDVK